MVYCYCFAVYPVVIIIDILLFCGFLITGYQFLTYNFSRCIYTVNRFLNFFVKTRSLSAVPTGSYNDRKTWLHCGLLMVLCFSNLQTGCKVEDSFQFVCLASAGFILPVISINMHPQLVPPHPHCAAGWAGAMFLAQGSNNNGGWTSLGIEPETLWLSGQYCNHLTAAATSVKQLLSLLYVEYIIVVIVYSMM